MIQPTVSRTMPPLMIAITAVAAMFLYIDRVCFSTLKDPIQKDLQIDPDRMAETLGIFFLTYALFQVPIGNLADRYGPRLVLALSIAIWSLITAATSLVQNVGMILLVRLALGAAEAGAYPAAATLIRNWVTPDKRGRYSSFVALGGRIGGAIAPFLTGFLAVNLMTTSTSETSEGNWRMVFLTYGLTGLLVAFVFWWAVRDRPTEAAPTWTDTKQETTSLSKQLQILASSGRMWCYGLTSCCLTLSWAFLITLFPTYLLEVHQMSLEQRGQIQSITLTASCVGMILGGFLTDRVYRSLGARWGRSIPIMVTLFGCAVACAIVPSLGDVWSVITALAVMALLVDMENPSIWAFAQDVGGKNVGAALGWGNMIGNLGAAVSPVLLNAIKKEYGWNTVFYTCAASFLIASLSGYFLDSSRPVQESK